MADRQKICRCGDSFGDFLIDINFMRDRVRDEKFPWITDYTLFTNPLYNKIKNVEEHCGLDIRKSESLYDDVYKGVLKMKNSKNEEEFHDGRSNVLTNINYLMSEVRNKVKECSK